MGETQTEVPAKKTADESSSNLAEGQVINAETAKKTVEGWLDHKRIKPRKRKEFKDQIETLEEAVQDATLIFNEDHTIVLPLVFPIKNDQGIVHLDKLTFKPRIMVHEVHSRLKKSDTDADSRIKAYVCVLTGQGSAVIGKIDSSDYSICNSIAVFFL